MREAVSAKLSDKAKSTLAPFLEDMRQCFEVRALASTLTCVQLCCFAKRADETQCVTPDIGRRLWHSSSYRPSASCSSTSQGGPFSHT